MNQILLPKFSHFSQSNCTKWLRSYYPRKKYSFIHFLKFQVYFSRNKN